MSAVDAMCMTCGSVTKVSSRYLTRIGRRDLRCGGCGSATPHERVIRDLEQASPAPVYDPAADLTFRWPGWRIHRTDLAGIPEVICTDERLLLVDLSAWPEGEAFATAHMIAHLDLGHHEAIGQFAADHERLADVVARGRMGRQAQT